MIGIQYDQSNAIAVTAKMASMAVYDPRPTRLIAIQKTTFSHTAMIGVPVYFDILYQKRDPGNISSREYAQMVRALA